MERFWRTLREGCLDHLGPMTSLHDVQARLLAFLDEHYHVTPHGGLFGKPPAEAWEGAVTRPVDEHQLATALTTHIRRRVHTDGTLEPIRVACSRSAWIAARTGLGDQEPGVRAPSS